MALPTRIRRRLLPPARVSASNAEVGAARMGAGAVGELAVGTFDLGALAIGRLAVGRARVERLEVDDLVFRRLRVLEDNSASGLHRIGFIDNSAEQEDISFPNGGRD